MQHSMAELRRDQRLTSALGLWRMLMYFLISMRERFIVIFFLLVLLFVIEVGLCGTENSLREVTSLDLLENSRTKELFWWTSLNVISKLAWETKRDYYSLDQWEINVQLSEHSFEVGFLLPVVATNLSSI